MSPQLARQLPRRSPACRLPVARAVVGHDTRAKLDEEILVRPAAESGSRRPVQGHDREAPGITPDSEGKDATVEILPSTTFKTGTKKGAQADLKVGMRIVASGPEGEPLKAKEIQYSTAPTTAKQ